MAKELQGVGWEKSGNIAGQFQNPLAMVQASVVEWRSIPGIGDTLAKRIVKVLQGAV
jgi:excinuclease UvrABC nuclease subunit